MSDPYYQRQRPVQGQPVSGQPPVYQGQPPQGQQPVYQQQQVYEQQQQYGYPQGQLPNQVVIQAPPNSRVERGPDATVHQPPPNYGSTTGIGQDPNNPTQGLVPSPDDRFPAKTNWVDVPWIPLFLLHTGAFIGLVAWQAYEAFKKTDPFESIQTDYPLAAKDVVYFMFTALCIGALVGYGILLLSRKFAKQIMWLSVILQAAMIIAMIVLAFTLGGVNAFSIIISILFLIIFVLLAISLRNSIGLAAALVGGAARAVQKNWGMQVMAIVYIACEAFLYGIAFLWLAAIIIKAEEEDWGWIGFLAIWGLFAFFWLRNTMVNVLHTTYSGSCARFFYMGDRQVANPTCASAKLACSKYFGAAAFGAFILSLIEWLRALAEMAKSDARRNNNLVGLILACICICILSCLESVFRIVNQFALIYTSIYGNKFWTSGKMVWKLAKATNLEPLFNDFALGLFTWCCSLLSFFLSGGLLGAFSYLVFEEMNLFTLISDYSSSSSGKEFPFVIALIYLFAMILCACLTKAVLQPLDSGARTLLVVFMEAPAYFSQNHPKVYAEVRDRAVKLKLVEKAPTYFIHH